jgi:hypothetical protein
LIIDRVEWPTSRLCSLVFEFGRKSAGTAAGMALFSSPLPSAEKSGLNGSRPLFRNVLVQF